MLLFFGVCFHDFQIPRHKSEKTLFQDSCEINVLPVALLNRAVLEAVNDFGLSVR